MRRQAGGQTWRMSANFNYGPNGQQQQPPPPLQPNPAWMATASIRKEHRELRESDVLPLLDEARAASEAAVGFAQSVVKSGFLLNGGGIVAIPAIVALFRLDASKGLWTLAAMGSAFVAGLLAAWAASICGFFAMANRSDASYSDAIRANNELNALFHPERQADFAAQSKQAAARALYLLGIFRKFRIAAIILCFAAVAGFVVGVGCGAFAVVKLQPKAESAPWLGVVSWRSDRSGCP